MGEGEEKVEWDEGERARKGGEGKVKRGLLPFNIFYDSSL